MNINYTLKGKLKISIFGNIELNCYQTWTACQRHQRHLTYIMWMIVWIGTTVPPPSGKTAVSNSQVQTRHTNNSSLPIHQGSKAKRIQLKNTG